MIRCSLEEEEVLRRIDNSILIKILNREIKESIGILKVNKNLEQLTYNQGAINTLEQIVEVVTN